MEAWFSAALDIEEVQSGARSDQLHVMVADVVKSFDTVDRSILDPALGRLTCLCTWSAWVAPPVQEGLPCFSLSG